MAIVSLSLFIKQYSRYRSLQCHHRLLTTENYESSTRFMWLTEGGVPLVSLVALSPILLSQILSKTGQSFYATLGVVTASSTLAFILTWGPALLHALLTKSLHPRIPPRALRHLPPTPSYLPKKKTTSFVSVSGGGETQDPFASLTVTPILDPAEVYHQGNLAGARRIAWMFERSSDSGTISVILRFILEVLWTPDHLQDTDSTNSALVRSYELLSESFDKDYTMQPVLLREMRGRAFAAAKSFIHIFIQGDYTSENPIIATLRDRHIPLGSSPSLRNNADLRSVIGIVDAVLGVRKPVQWPKLPLSPLHQLWFSHILLFRAWYATKHGAHIPDFVTGFVKHSLGSNPRPRLAVITDCVLVVGFIVGYPLHEADLLVWRKK